MDEHERHHMDLVAQAVAEAAQEAGCDCEMTLDFYSTVLGTVVVVDHDPQCRLMMAAKADLN